MNNNSPREVLGIDIGRTIVQTIASGQKYPFPGALRVIKRLITERFGDNTYIISKVNPEQKVRVEAWIQQEGLHELTLLPREHVYFCAERHEKAPIAKELGITHFIDDRPEVLSHMEFVPYRFLFQGNENDYQKFRDKLDGITRVNTWSEIERYLL